MSTLARRSFLSTVSSSLVTLAARPLVSAQTINPACWLDVCAPFIVEDLQRGIATEIILTSDTFAGARGHEGSASATDYEILLYDPSGRAIGSDGVARRMTIPALRTTVVPVCELLGNGVKFWGGMKIRLRPRQGTHASDLFSSAFVRWQTKESFDNVHANPDPRQWQNTQSYYYSMPFPSLDEYDCTFSLFNANKQPCAGRVTLRNPQGRVLCEKPYELNPHASLLFNLNTGATVTDPWSRAVSRLHSGPGLLSVVNDEGKAKGFGYLMIRSHERERFSVEHPIHQGLITPRSAPEPFDGEGKFKARNVLYTPLIFRQRQLGSISLESRCYFGTGLPIENAVWLYPFATDDRGEAVWSTTADEGLKSKLPPGRLQRGAIRLNSGESCALDFARTSLRPGFAGGLGVAVAPDISHTLMKLEVRVPEWGAHAFTHFRPGLRSARLYQKPKERGGLVSDYIVAGARYSASKAAIEHDELIGVLNIDDQGIEAHPVLELFGKDGLVGRYPLGVIAPFACRHYLLSDLLGRTSHDQLTLRLVDERVALLMSAVHLDYSRREIALDHGSDRFSTFLDYDCG